MYLLIISLSFVMLKNSRLTQIGNMHATMAKHKIIKPLKDRPQSKVPRYSLRNMS